MFSAGQAFDTLSRCSRTVAMHELSIANRIVEIAGDRCREEAARAKVVTVRIGALSCVHEDALRFSFELVREGTPLADAELRVVTVPVAIWCGTCDREVELPGIQRISGPAANSTWSRSNWPRMRRVEAQGRPRRFPIRPHRERDSPDS
jgi:hydrogenase nickel incorporation protein HypA/HybF